MTQDKFAKLIERFTKEAKDHPLRHRIRVALVAIFGYMFVFGAPIAVLVLIGSIAAGTGIVIVEVFASIGFVTIAVFRALTIKIARPKGLLLERSASPRLFEIIEEIRQNLKSPVVDHVVLTTDFNASLLQRPRFGIFGFHESYLQLGFPLFLAFSLEHFRALVAHELGHLSGNHSRFIMWVYRMRVGSARLQETFRIRKGLLPAIYNEFFSWYLGYLGACSSVLDRSFEYECDLLASNITCSRAVGEMLVRLEGCANLWATPYWEQVWSQSKGQATPPIEVFPQLRAQFEHRIVPEHLRTFITAALAESVSSEDSHPSLKDRLMALGFNVSTCTDDFVSWLSPLNEMAADHFFQGNLPSICSRMDSIWNENVKAIWADTFEKSRVSRKELADLETKASQSTLNNEERWTLICRISENRGTQEAVALLQAFLQESPEHVSACRLLGEYLLACGDGTGIAFIERAMAIDPYFAPFGSQRIASFYHHQGNEELALMWRERSVHSSEEVTRARQERSRITIRDTYRPHGQSTEKLDALRQQLIPIRNLKRVYFVRRDVKFLPNIPCYVAGIVSNGTWFSRRAKQEEKALADQLAGKIIWPNRTHVFAIGRLWRLRRVIGKTPDAKVFER